MVNSAPQSSWLFEAGCDSDDRRAIETLQLIVGAQVVVAHQSAFSRPVVLPSVRRFAPVVEDSGVAPFAAKTTHASAVS